MPVAWRFASASTQGEAAITGQDVRGLAVHTAARIMSLAAPGEVLVSATTRELANAAGVEFVDRGEHDLSGEVDQKGLKDTRRLFAGTLPVVSPEIARDAS